jgi:hypothetical protein
MIHFGEILMIVAKEIVAYFNVITRHSFDGSKETPQ